MSGKHTFTYEPDTASNPHDETSVTVGTRSESLVKVIDAMESYLLAAGYVFPENCHLGWEEDESVETRFDEADLATHLDNGS